jgi:O-succinylbenzoic acid--CoA ligase
MIGRADFAINTGGVKLIPEYIEQLIEQNISPKVAFVISSSPDDALGDKVVLASPNVNAFDRVDFSFLNQYSKYAIPKLILNLDEIPLNQSNKIDRIKIKNTLSKSLS